MAQKRKGRFQPRVALQLRFRAEIDMISSTVLVGDWIVGYPVPTPEKRGDQAPNLDFDYENVLPEDWLTATMNQFDPTKSDREAARRFVRQYGTFRQADWHTVNEALTSGLPAEVKDEVRRSGVPGGEKLYFIRVSDFYREWRVIQLLGLISTGLTSHASLAMVKLEIDECSKFLGEAQQREGLPRTPTTSTRSNQTMTQLFGELLSPTPDSLATRFPSATLRARYPNWFSLPIQLRSKLGSIFGTAFSRALETPQYGISLWNPDRGPTVNLQARSILGAAYLALLANFSQGWKKCKREDCGNLFRMTDDRRKTFCCQYCAHLENLREKRKDAKRKVQTKFRRGGKL
jgi:hypothetical protein